MDVRKIIGWNLRRLRVERAISQERLGLEADIDRSYIGRIERGSENVTVATLEAVSRVLNVHVSELFAPVDPGAKPLRALKGGRPPHE